MNKTLLVSGIIGLVVVVGVVSLVMQNSSSTVTNTPQVAAATQTVSTVSTTTTSSVPLMQSTGQLFAQSKYAAKAHEIAPTLAADTKAALGAFNYTRTDLGGGVTRFTLTNSAEGYKGQSVVVGPGQTLYFVEPSMGDDSASEDSVTTDDFFVVVDAQGTILK